MSAAEHNADISLDCFRVLPSQLVATRLFSHQALLRHTILAAVACIPWMQQEDEQAGRHLAQLVSQLLQLHGHGHIALSRAHGEPDSRAQPKLQSMLAAVLAEMRSKVSNMHA